MAARASMVNDAERVDVPSVAGKGPSSVSRQILCEIIEPRLDEIFELVRKEVAKSGFEGALTSGIVITGGSMLLPGAVEMAERSFGLPVRLGVLARVRGLIGYHRQPDLRHRRGAGPARHEQRARRLLRARGQNSFQGQASDVGLAQRVLLIETGFINSFWRRKDYV